MPPFVQCLLLFSTSLGYLYNGGIAGAMNGLAISSGFVVGIHLLDAVIKGLKKI
jgi:hypothetical protein